MAWILSGIISCSLAVWISRRQGRRLIGWLIASLLFPPTALILSQLRATAPLLRIFGGFVAVALSVAIVFFVVDWAGENESVCAVVASVTKVLLTCVGIDVYSEGAVLVGDKVQMRVGRPFSQIIMSLGPTFILAISLFRTSTVTRLGLVGAGVGVGLLADLLRNTLLYRICLLHGGYSEPYYVSRFFWHSMQVPVIFAIAACIAASFVYRQEQMNRQDALDG